MKRWIITVSSQRPIHEVAGELGSKGLHVEQVLDAVGSVIGQAEPDRLDLLRKVVGVEAIEPDLPFDVGPPDAPVS